MKSTVFSLAMISAALVAVSCANVGGGAFPTAERLVGPEASPETADAFVRGRAITMTECGTCHRLFKPHEFDPARWAFLGDDMGKRSGLSAEQIADMVRYLQAASARARAAREAAKAGR